MELTSFCGHINSWVGGIHDAEITPTLFGAGWRLRGLYALHVQKVEAATLDEQGLPTTRMIDRGVTLVRPGERPVYYHHDVPAGRYETPTGDYASLSALLDEGGYRYEEKDGTRWTFDADGRLQERRDRNGNRTRYGYDARGRLIRVTDPVGLSTLLRYRSGYLWQVEDPAGRVSEFERDGRGRLVGVRYPDGSRESYEYDSRDLLVVRQDERTQRTAYEYDRHGHVRRVVLADGSAREFRARSAAGLYEPGSGTLERPVPGVLQGAAQVGAERRDARGFGKARRLDSHSTEVWMQDALGRVSLHERDADSNALRTTRVNGSVVERRFDGNGNVLSAREAFNGATTRYTYDVYSLLTSVTNPRGNVTRYERDGSGNVTRMTDAAGHVSTYQYDSRGLVTEERTPNGLVRTYTYNVQGLIERVVETPPSGSPGSARTTRLEYHASGQPSRLVMPDGVELRMDYDERNRLLRVRDSLGRAREFTYDAYGNAVRTETRSAAGIPAHWMRAVYDARNRLVEEGYPHVGDAESVYRYALDAESNLVGTTDPRGAESRSAYDPVNRMVRSVHRLGGVTEYGYDALDRLVRVQAPNGVVTEYAYDALGRRVEERSADRGRVRYTYDLANNVTSMTDARGVTSRYVYDRLERVTEVRYPNSHEGKDETVRYSYDGCTLGKGRLCGVQDESGSSAYHYDAWGNVVEHRRTELRVEYVSRYRYDAGDRVVRQELPSRRILEYGRDALRRVSGVRAEVGGAVREVVSALAYRADDLMEYCRYGNGLEDRRSYDLQGRLLRQEWSTSSGRSVHRREYGYDANGNVERLGVDGLSRRYGYDALDRLSSDGGVSPTAEYGYDANDNRLRRDLSDASLRSEYLYEGSSNRLDVVESIERTDASVVTVSSSRRMEYNDAGRLWRLYEDGVLLAEYVYNAAGQRTRKVVHDGESSTVTVFHYGLAGELQSETDGAGRSLRDYVWVNGQTVAQIDVVRGDNGSSRDKLLYLYPDHLMTSRAATDDTGQVVWTWDGGAFGAGAADTDPDGDGTETHVSLRFPGQYQDAESGWHYNWNRYYDPSLGRYIQSDPIGLQGGWNTYGYVSGNPLRYIDPFGLLPQCSIWRFLLGNCPKIGEDITIEDAAEEFREEMWEEWKNKPCNEIWDECKDRMGLPCYFTGTPCLLICETLKQKCEEGWDELCESIKG